MCYRRTAMHELSVTESLLEIALKHAQNAGAKRITALHLVIGQLASIVDDSVQFYWDFVAKDTLAEGAALTFRRISTEFQCLDCQKRYAPDGNVLACPQCGSTRIKIMAGEEFFLEAIDVEQ
jgi:hydrogenase nickel incorporation protein HypA/HybF